MGILGFLIDSDSRSAVAGKFDIVCWRSLSHRQSLLIIEPHRNISRVYFSPVYFTEDHPVKLSAYIFIKVADSNLEQLSA